MTSSNKPSRIVIDTNVWISALVFGGAPRAVFEHALRQGVTIVVSEAILTEVRRTLHDKFPDFLDDFEALLVALSSIVSVVPLGEITIRVSRDPDDNAIIETAVIGNASVTISGDKDLLSLQDYEGVTFIMPSKYVALVS